MHRKKGRPPRHRQDLAQSNLCLRAKPSGYPKRDPRCLAAQLCREDASEGEAAGGSRSWWWHSPQDQPAGLSPGFHQRAESGGREQGQPNHGLGSRGGRCLLTDRSSSLGQGAWGHRSCAVMGHCQQVGGPKVWVLPATGAGAAQGALLGHAPSGTLQSEPWHQVAPRADPYLAGLTAGHSATGLWWGRAVQLLPSSGAGQLFRGRLGRGLLWVGWDWSCC